MTSGRAQLLATMVLACVAQAGAATAQSQQQAPIVLAREGAFEAGGKVISGDKGTLSCDHGYVEYQIPVDARSVALFLWHSSSAKVWQNRWDGGEGFQSIFLRRGFPVYMWDGRALAAVIGAARPLPTHPSRVAISKISSRGGWGRNIRTGSPACSSPPTMRKRGNRRRAHAMTNSTR